MTKESTARFLEQFAKSERNIAGWAEWMRNSATVAAASLPKSREVAQLQEETLEQLRQPKQSGS